MLSNMSEDVFSLKELQDIVSSFPENQGSCNDGTLSDLLLSANGKGLILRETAQQALTELLETGMSA